MLKTIFAIVLILTFPQISNGEYLSRFQCRQNISTIKNAIPEYTQLEARMTWYKIDEPLVKFGSVESDIVSYKFWGDYFYGMEVGIVGKENINELLRYFKKEAERIYNNNADLEMFSKPIRNKGDEWLFLMPNEVIILKRFSVNLGQLEVVCRARYFKFIGVSDPVNSQKK